MTTGCLEYWLILHYEKQQSPIYTSTQKDNLLRYLQKKYCHNYKKGDLISTSYIAQNYNTAIINGKWTIEQLYDKSQYCVLKQTDDDWNYYEWLYKNTMSFSNVYEALEFLEKLRL